MKKKKKKQIIVLTLVMIAVAGLLSILLYYTLTQQEYFYTENFAYNNISWTFDSSHNVGNTNINNGGRTVTIEFTHSDKIYTSINNVAGNSGGDTPQGNLVLTTQDLNLNFSNIEKIEIPLIVKGNAGGDDTTVGGSFALELLDGTNSVVLFSKGYDFYSQLNIVDISITRSLTAGQWVISTGTQSNTISINESKIYNLKFNPMLRSSCSTLSRTSCFIELTINDIKVTKKSECDSLWESCINQEKWVCENNIKVNKGKINGYCGYIESNNQTNNNRTITISCDDTQYIINVSNTCLYAGTCCQAFVNQTSNNQTINNNTLKSVNITCWAQNNLLDESFFGSTPQCGSKLFINKTKCEGSYYNTSIECEEANRDDNSFIWIVGGISLVAVLIVVFLIIILNRRSNKNNKIR